MLCSFIIFSLIATIVIPILALVYFAYQDSCFPPPSKSTKSVILVTGCDSGFGRLTAVALVKLGFHVVATCMLDETIKSLGDEVSKFSGAVSVIRCDITKDEDVKKVRNLVDELLAKESGKQLVGVVNNAGILVGGPLEYVPMDRVEFQFQVNTFGHIRVTQVFLPLLRQSKGRIVNVVSIAGKVAGGLMGPYSASKHAMEAVTDTFRKELRRFGIAVVAIEPGFMLTPLLTNAVNNFEKSWEAFPAEAREIYHREYQAGVNAKGGIAKKLANDPTKVSAAIVDALTSPNPLTRYKVGNDAKILGVLNAYLPDRWQDVLNYGVARLQKSQYRNRND